MEHPTGAPVRRTTRHIRSRVLVPHEQKEQDVRVDNHEGSVASRSRALFDQLRHRTRPSTHPPGE
ncbi:MAG TPA: hypothetical protein VMU14_19645, partial [Acidimicrobiales bacterium]|nr:hypothetical protein [Acidimicrobiales bacterium]